MQGHIFGLAVDFAFENDFCELVDEEYVDMESNVLSNSSQIL